MKVFRRLLFLVPAAALVVCLVATYLTRGAMAHLPFLRSQGAGGASSGLVDQRPWQTIEALAPLAVSAEEQRIAHEAERLADHEVDQAFAMALRLAAMDTRTLTGNALALQQKVAGLAQVVKEDQAHVDTLTASAKPSTIPGGAAISDDLEMAKAQLQLDTDELADATQQFARASGDQRGQIQQELTARNAAMKKFDAAANSTGQLAIVSSKQYGTLYGRASAWFDQRNRVTLIEQAKDQADADAAALATQHQAMQKKAATDVAAAASPGTPADAGSSVQSRVARMNQAHALAQINTILEDRLQTQQQLSAVYAKWLSQAQLQHSIVAHLALQSLSLIAFLILCSILISTAARSLLERSKMDPRRLHTLRTITILGIQFLTLLLMLLVVFGAPSQVPTILGLATAGLTVVFQDFILAFFGWFVLMGRSGIRVGDWVEINGVGGEVLEIGLFRTSLLETGNWTDKGHPTGRRVTFINNFAISGQYFNFSTAGQWMWDEISVNIPQSADTYQTIEAIHKAVLKQTEKDAALAQDEWQRSTKQNGLSQFTAQPSVDMRPASSGVDIIVRYVTRAGDRFDMRNHLYQAVIDLLHKPDAGGSKESKSASDPAPDQPPAVLVHG
jgi:small-conductance mechanosensitive channel